MGAPRKPSKTTPTWKGEKSRSHRPRLEKLNDKSVVQAHRGGTIIVEECVMLNEKMSHDDKTDVAYALELMADCVGMLNKRLQVEKKKTQKKKTQKKTAKRR